MAKSATAGKTFYYPMQYPFSVDLDMDERNDQAPSGHFARCINYIPKGQVLESRKGITEWS